MQEIIKITRQPGAGDVGFLHKSLQKTSVSSIINCRETLIVYLTDSTELLIIVLQFLNLKEISYLDSSNTNIKLRVQFLKRLHEMTHNLFHDIMPNESMTKWIIKRRIRVEKMVFEMYKNEPYDNWFESNQMQKMQVTHLVESSNDSYLKNINISSINNITDNGIITLIKSSPLLHTIRLNCWNITDLSIFEISKGCPLLRDIDLFRCTQITDLSIFELIKGCPLLEKIDLECCINITNDSIIAISKGCLLLKDINIWNCDSITDFSIIELSKGCPLLQNISLADCDQITDDSIIAISKGCILLENINLTGLEEITDFGIIELSKRCPYLKNINLSYCRQITTLSIIELSKRCILLQSIDVNECRNITKLDLIEIIKNFPFINILIQTEWGTWPQI